MSLAAPAKGTIMTEATLPTLSELAPHVFRTPVSLSPVTPEMLGWLEWLWPDGVLEAIQVALASDEPVCMGEAMGPTRAWYVVWPSVGRCVLRVGILGEVVHGGLWAETGEAIIDGFDTAEPLHLPVVD